jgi:hypothetical protein
MKEVIQLTYHKQRLIGGLAHMELVATKDWKNSRHMYSSTKIIE